MLQDDSRRAYLNEQLQQIGLQFIEIPISADSPLVGITIDEIDPHELAAVVIVAVRTAADEIRRNPHGTTPLKSGDTLILVGRRGDAPKTLHRATRSGGITYRGSRA
jgi:voltage-gated potassium channel